MSTTGLPSATANPVSAVTLRTVIDARRRLDELGTARLIGEAAEVVHKAQAQGQPLGTLSPEAIIVRDGHVVIDRPADVSVLSYSAPERIGGGSGDRRSDVFSLGAILWEALAHVPLFAGDDATIQKAIQAAEIPSIVELNANVPAELDAICKKALARDPADRYQSCKVMAAEISAVLDDAGYPEDNAGIQRWISELPPDTTSGPSRASTHQTTMTGLAPIKVDAGESAVVPLEVKKAKPETQPPAKVEKPLDVRLAEAGEAVRKAETRPPEIKSPQPASPVALASLVGKSASDTLVDRKPADTTPAVATTKPPEAKPLEAKPLETKPPETKPAQKPAEAGPALPNWANKGTTAPPANTTLTGSGVTASAVIAAHAAASAPATTPPPKPAGTTPPPVHAAPATPLPPVLPGGLKLPSAPPGATIAADTPPAIAPAIAAAASPVIPPPTVVNAAPMTPAIGATTAILGSGASTASAPATPQPFSGARTQVLGSNAIIEATNAAVSAANPPTVEPPKDKDKKPELPAPFRGVPAVVEAPVAKPESVSAAQTLQKPAAELKSVDWDVPPAATPSVRPPTLPPTQDTGSGAVKAVAPLTGSGSVKSAAASTGSGSVKSAAASAGSGSMPRARRPTNKDPLGGWGWGTDSHAALATDDDDAYYEDDRRKTKKRLFIAIGAAGGAVLLLVVVALALGGSSDKDEAKPDVAAKPADPAPVADPPKADPPPAPPEPAKADTPPVEEPKPEPTPPEPLPEKPDDKAAKVEEPKPEPAKPEPTEPPRTDPPKKDPPKKIVKKDPPKRIAKKDPPKKVVKKDPPRGELKLDAAAAYKTGLQQFARGDANGALATFKSSLASDPGFAPTWRGIGLVYEKLGKKSQASTAFKRYLQLSPHAGDAAQIRSRLERL